MIDMRKLDWSVGYTSGTGGAYPKSTFIKDGIKYYVKMSAYNSAHLVYGIESISEVIAYRLAQKLKINCASYKLVNALVEKDGREFTTYLTISRDFEPKGGSKESFEKFYAKNKINETTIEFIKRYGFQKDIYKMFIFDYIIHNMDRHGANVEVIKTGKGFKIAPLFDNGASLLFNRGEFELQEPNENSPVNNFIGTRSLVDNLGLIDMKIHLGELLEAHRMRLFTGIEHLISEERSEAIWNMIWRRYNYVREFLRI